MAYTKTKGIKMRNGVKAAYGVSALGRWSRVGRVIFVIYPF